MKIMLDAGHFGKQNRSPILPEYYESVMTWELSHRLQAALEQYGITVGQTRSQQEVDMPVYQRGKSSAGYDLFISVHSNAFSDANIDRPTIFVNLDGSTTELGKKLGASVRQVMGTSQKESITWKEWEGRPGVEYYGVLRGAKDAGTPGMIIEHSFHTNLRSALWLSDSNNLERLAQAEAAVIAAHFGVSTPVSEAVRWAQEQGILKADAGGSYRLGEFCTREELAEALFRFRQIGT